MQQQDSSPLAIPYDALADAVYRAELDEDAIYADYSGRAMYGSKCLGIVTDRPSEAGVVVLELLDAKVIDGDDARSMLRGARTDSLGLSTITYWPAVTVMEAR